MVEMTYCRIYRRNYITQLALEITQEDLKYVASQPIATATPKHKEDIYNFDYRVCQVRPISLPDRIVVLVKILILLSTLRNVWGFNLILNNVHLLGKRHVAQNVFVSCY